MHELILRDYFLGLVDESRLSEDLEGSIVQTSFDVFSYHVIPMNVESEVIPAHLVKLCNAVLSGKLEAQHLEIIGFCLVASDGFIWDEDTESGNLVAETVHDWASPEINYPLTNENVEKFRERLLTGKDTFTRADAVK